MKKISLTKGYVTIVDDDDFETLMKYSWRAKKPPKSNDYYAVTNLKIKGKITMKGMHQLLMNFPVKPLVVDHINRNTLDNQRCNLRVCTVSQNAANCKRQRNSTSGFQGVTWQARAKKWQSQIMFSGRKHYLGLFEDKAEAARAYDAKAIELFGEFASLNFTQEDR